jgi:hypothetical protein
MLFYTSSLFLGPAQPRFRCFPSIGNSTFHKRTWEDLLNRMLRDSSIIGFTNFNHVLISLRYDQISPCRGRCRCRCGGADAGAGAVVPMTVTVQRFRYRCGGSGAGAAVRRLPCRCGGAGAGGRLLSVIVADAGGAGTHY